MFVDCLFQHSSSIITTSYSCFDSAFSSVNSSFIRCLDDGYRGTEYQIHRGKVVNQIRIQKKEKKLDETDSQQLCELQPESEKDEEKKKVKLQQTVDESQSKLSDTIVQPAANCAVRKLSDSSDEPMQHGLGKVVPASFQHLIEPGDVNPILPIPESIVSELNKPFTENDFMPIEEVACKK